MINCHQMIFKFFCPRWGSEDISWDNFLTKVKSAGYSGIEYAISNEITKTELEQIWGKVEEHGLEIIPQHYATYEANFSKHFDLFSAWFEKIKPFKALKIDSQTGKDFFSFDQNKSLIDVAVNYTKKTGVDVYHETHRNKFAFAAHITKDYLIKLPYLKLTLDISHWVNVAESFLEDQKEAVDLAIARTEHIHARVGYPEGPQVSDPRAPEWQEALCHHLAWWDKIVKKKLTESTNSEMTITPEFGPYPYMVHLPYTSKPISNQWDVNVYIMKLLKERYEPYFN